MGIFTVLDEPQVDRLIQSHMEMIVDLIRQRMEPQAIILRGSFGRGEGSVYVQGRNISFLSDYEIEVIADSPKYRGLLKQLSSQLSRNLQVETSLRWQRPDFLTRERVGPVTIGPAEPTISMYELRYGSRTLYGQDLFKDAPEVKTSDITLDCGLFLILNRMAESLDHMQPVNGTDYSKMAPFYWVNKTILACLEALLLLWGQYHYSYEERGRRFSSTAPEDLNFMGQDSAELLRIAARATEYKLRPRLELYPESLRETWEETYPIIDQVLRHYIASYPGFPITDYADFPELFLNATREQIRQKNTSGNAAHKLLDFYRCLINRTLPTGLFSELTLAQQVYSVVPLLFMAQFTADCKSELASARKIMARIGEIDSPSEDLRREKTVLTDRLIWFWKAFCHG